jgi:hypothetical protein
MRAMKTDSSRGVRRTRGKSETADSERAPTSVGDSQRQYGATTIPRRPRLNGNAGLNPLVHFFDFATERPLLRIECFPFWTLAYSMFVVLRPPHG